MTRSIQTGGDHPLLRRETYVNATLTPADSVNTLSFKLENGLVVTLTKRVSGWEAVLNVEVQEAEGGRKVKVCHGIKPTEKIQMLWDSLQELAFELSNQELAGIVNRVNKLMGEQ